MHDAASGLRRMVLLRGSVNKVKRKGRGTVPQPCGKATGGLALRPKGDAVRRDPIGASTDGLHRGAAVQEGMFSVAKHPPLPMSIRPTAVFEPETAVKTLLLTENDAEDLFKGLFRPH
jgi:hypothetical protein